MVIVGRSYSEVGPGTGGRCRAAAVGPQQGVLTALTVFPYSEWVAQFCMTTVRVSKSHSKGYSKSHSKGHSKGHSRGYSKSHIKGHIKGHSECHSECHSKGHSKSYSKS